MSWNVKYVFLILATTVVSYFTALFIEKTDSKGKKKGALAAALVVCLGILVVFKYLDFAFGTIESVLKVFSIEMHPIVLNLMLPVGISFYTFQTLSYVIDVYRGSTKAEHHFGYYATFISFFPNWWRVLLSVQIICCHKLKRGTVLTTIKPCMGYVLCYGGILRKWS